MDEGTPRDERNNFLIVTYGLISTSGWWSRSMLLLQSLYMFLYDFLFYHNWSLLNRYKGFYIYIIKPISLFILLLYCSYINIIHSPRTGPVCWVLGWRFKLDDLGRSQDGGGIGWGDHFLFYKFIERTTERWTKFTKQLLIASSGHRRPEKQPIVFEGR